MGNVPQVIPLVSICTIYSIAHDVRIFSVLQMQDVATVRHDKNRINQSNFCINFPWWQSQQLCCFQTNTNIITMMLFVLCYSGLKDNFSCLKNVLSKGSIGSSHLLICFSIAAMRSSRAPLFTPRVTVRDLWLWQKCVHVHTFPLVSTVSTIGKHVQICRTIQFLSCEREP